MENWKIGRLEDWKTGKRRDALAFLFLASWPLGALAFLFLASWPLGALASLFLAPWILGVLAFLFLASWPLGAPALLFFCLAAYQYPGSGPRENGDSPCRICSNNALERSGAIRPPSDLRSLPSRLTYRMGLSSGSNPNRL